MVAPGCQLQTQTIDLNEDFRIEATLNCKNEKYVKTDLTYLSETAWGKLFDDEVNPFTLNILRNLEKDELHVMYEQGRVSDSEYRRLLTEPNQ